MSHVNESTPDHLEAQECFANRYHYKAEVQYIYDADTVTLMVDLGFGIQSKKVVRLSRINAWEMRGDEREKGICARDWLRSAIPVNSTVYIRTEKDRTGKYGRYLAEIYALEEGNYISINDELVSLGHARYQDYK